VTSVLLGKWGQLPKWFRGSILLSGLLILATLLVLYECSPQRLATRFDKPMTLDQAKRIQQLADFPFPSSAHDIYFAAYADWTIYATLIRFDASPQDCETIALELVRWNRTLNKANDISEYVPIPINGQRYLTAPDRDFLPEVKWWDDVIVRHGLFVGEEGEGRPQVWVDYDLKRVYYYESD
jgi:hypothetical protein